MAKRHRITGAAAGCAVAVATLLGTPSIHAQDVVEPNPPPPGLVEPVQPPPGVFIKISELDYPGHTEVAEIVLDELKVVWGN